jgi:pimeloyl-ACP methyl ester carboxylesterase
VGLAPAASAQSPSLSFAPCGDAAGVTCTNVKAPLDYDRPAGPQVKLFVAKVAATDQAHKLGSLFINFGGPGGTTADYLEARAAGIFSAFHERYDIIGMDPRGVGQSTPSIDCKANQETQGIYSVPFPTPDNVSLAGLAAKDLRYIARCQRLNGPILEHVSTANVARDMDLIRAGLGERRLSYFGYSYGTFLGATYASLFPTHYKRMVLDGPVDATAYINTPEDDLSAQSDAFEREYGRFFQACARDQVACSGFGGDDPWDAYDQLVDRANASPIPATSYAADPRPVTGDDILIATSSELYDKAAWGDLAQRLAAAENGDGGPMRELTDGNYGYDPETGTFDPISDRYFTIGASEQRYPRNPAHYLRTGKRSYDEHDHTWWNNGYVELNYALWPSRDRDAYAGPFRIPNSSPTPLVVATTYDPATPYRGAKALVRDLGNARLLTMRGDGHTAYPGNSPDCIDPAVEAYLNTGALPAAGTSCKQDVPFAAPEAAATAKALAAPAAAARRRLHVTRFGLTR